MHEQGGKLIQTWDFDRYNEIIVIRGIAPSSVDCNLERHARQDHLLRITRGNGCQGARAAALVT